MTDRYDPEQDEGDEEFDFEAKTIDVSVKAFLTMNMYINHAQINIARTILVTDSKSETGEDGPFETFTGVDGVTGQPIEVRISFPSGD